jgi:transposase
MSNKELILQEKATLETTGEEIRRLERKAIDWELGESPTGHGKRGN